MKRKVNRVGTNTLTVSLPKKWAERYNLKPGDELEVVEKGKQIIINHDKESLLGEKELDFRDIKDFPRRLLMTPYVQGYDQIVIKYNKKATLHRLKKNMQLFMGFEIIKESEKEVVLKNVASGIEGEFENMMNRMNHLVSHMGKELLESLKKDDKEEIGYIRDYEETGNKLNLFCRRMLNTKGSYGRQETTSAYHTNCLLESITDAYRDICSYVLEKNMRISKSLIDLFQSILDQYDYFLKMWNNYSENQISKMKEKEMEVLRAYYSLRLKPEEMIIAGQLIRAHYAIRHATEELN